MDRYDPYTDKFLRDTQYDILGTNLAQVGTDLISRQAAIDALRTCYDTETITMDNGDEYINYGDAVGEIEQLPPIQPKKGKWSPADSLYHGAPFYYCSECGEKMLDTVMGKPRWNFCPNCGAKMEGADDE